MSTVFKNILEDRDMAVLGEEPTLFMLKVWIWILMHSIDIFDKDISILWLLPLSNSHH